MQPRAGCSRPADTMSSEDVGRKLLDIPSNILVHHILALFAETPLDIIRFGYTCKTAYKLASDLSLWSQFCKGFPHPDPAPWDALDAKHLYLALVLPYSHLLRHLWHSTTWPVGQLVRVDAEPPRLVARSLYFKSLNGGPYCHDVFMVELMPGQMHARVTCWRDKHGAEGFESDAELLPAAPAAHIAAGSNASSTMAALDLAPASACTSIAAASSSLAFSGCSSGRSRAAVTSRNGFMLCCKSRCDSVVTEFTNRKTKAKPYEQVRQRYLATCSSHSCDSSVNSPRLPNSPGSSVNHSSSSSSSSNGAGSLLPLPDVQQQPTIELIHFITLSDMRPSFSTPVYKQLDLRPWLCRPYSSSSSSSSIVTTLDHSHTSSLGAIGSLQQHTAFASSSGCSADADLLLGSVLSLTGLWRGTYGSHGVELLQLQLLEAPPGYDMFSTSESSSTISNSEPAGVPAGLAAAGTSSSSNGPESIAAALADDAAVDGAPGVLLRGLAGMSGARTAADIPTLYAELPVEAAAGAAAAPAESLVVVYDNPAVAAAAGGDAGQQQQQGLAGGSAANGASTSSSGDQAQLLQQRQLLLVATKLTGDMNVPVGHVTFAVDVGSHVPAGNEPLHLTGSTDTDVRVNTAGTRQLRIKERYRGRAQIAFTGFQAPAIIAAELLVFTDSDVLGLLWKKPVDSFSLFSRVAQLP